MRNGIQVILNIRHVLERLLFPNTSFPNNYDTKNIKFMKNVYLYYNNSIRAFSGFSLKGISVRNDALGTWIGWIGIKFHNIQSAYRSKGVNFYSSPWQVNHGHFLKL